MASEIVSIYIQKQPEDKRPLLHALRQLVLETIPEISETVKWGYPCYGVKTNVIYLAPHQKHVNFGFYFGGSLEDPDRLLEGTGAQMRHIKIRKLEDIKPELFRKLIKAAVAHQK